MGTKTNPGEFDCHAKASPDEPLFTLLARDRHAPAVIELWAILRAIAGEDEAVVNEALACAADMRRWYFEKKGAHAPEHFSVLESETIEDALQAATDGNPKHLENYWGPCWCDECTGRLPAPGGGGKGK